MSCRSTPARRAEGPWQQVSYEHGTDGPNPKLLQANCHVSVLISCGHFSQPVVRGCTCAWPADPHNHSAASLLPQRSRPRRWTGATNLQSRVHGSSIVPGSSPVCEAATQSFSMPDSCQPLLLAPVTQAATRMDSAALVRPCCQQQETLEDLCDSMQSNQGSVLCWYCPQNIHVSLTGGSIT